MGLSRTPKSRHRARCQPSIDVVAQDSKLMCESMHEPGPRLFRNVSIRLYFGRDRDLLWMPRGVGGRPVRGSLPIANVYSGSRKQRPQLMLSSMFIPVISQQLIPDGQDYSKPSSNCWCWSGLNVLAALAKHPIVDTLNEIEGLLGICVDHKSTVEPWLILADGTRVHWERCACEKGGLRSASSPRPKWMEGR